MCLSYIILIYAGSVFSTNFVVYRYGVNRLKFISIDFFSFSFLFFVIRRIVNKTSNGVFCKDFFFFNQEKCMYRINATDQLTVFVYVDNDTSSFFSFFLYFYERDARYRIALETRTTREIGRCYCAQIEPNSRLSFSRALLFFSFFFSFFFLLSLILLVSTSPRSFISFNWKLVSLAYSADRRIN